MTVGHIGSINKFHSFLNQGLVDSHSNKNFSQKAYSKLGPDVNNNQLSELHQTFKKQSQVITGASNALKTESRTKGNCP